MTMPSVNFRSLSLRKALFTVAFVIATVFAVGSVLFPVRFAPAGVQDGLSPIRTLEKPVLPFSHPYDGELPAKGKFLVASRAIADPRFQETVVLLIANNAGGATGLIINRPTKEPLAEMLSEPGLTTRSDVIYYGGPVEGDRVLMLIRSHEKPDEADKVFANVYVSMSRNTLDTMIGAHKTQKQLRVYAGYAGWLPQQLNREVSRGDWYVVNADADAIFEKESSGIWRDLIRQSTAIEVWKHDKDKRSKS